AEHIFIIDIGSENIIRARVLKARSGVKRVGIWASNLNAFAGHSADADAIGRRHRVLDAEIRARAGLDPIVPREFVEVEQQSVVENQALSVLVRGFGIVRDIRPGNDLGDGLYYMRGTVGVSDKGIAVIETGSNHLPGKCIGPAFIARYIPE